MEGSQHIRNIWFARIMVGIVFAWNVICALQFVLWPGDFAAGYGLEQTEASKAAISGIGVAFLMWNTTYPLVIVNPDKHMTLFGVILAQQAIGLAGESVILAQLSSAAASATTAAAMEGIWRFIAFDAAGLLMMAIAFFVLRRSGIARGNYSRTNV
ncbi:MAG: hypothetical protein IJH04_10115 [Eggerthellaceae bacterium]|nr:hypothetical protein [Eggerthellaceae bacterium]